jgi:MFS family permease
VILGAPYLLPLMLALLAAHLAGMGAFLTVPVLAPAIAAETGLPASLAGLHTALAYLGAMLTGPLTAGLIRRYGGVRVLQVGLLAIAAGLAVATIGHPLALVAAAVVAGMGHGPITPGGSHLIAARTPPRRRALVFSLKQTGVPAGAMAVAAIAPAAALAFGGWRAGIWVMAGIAVLAALAIQPLRAPLDQDRDPAAGGAGPGAVLAEAARALAMLRSNRALRRLTIMSCGYGIAQFCFLTFFVVYQVAQLGASLAEAGLMLALGQAAGVFGRIFWALMADRGGARPVLVGCGLGAAAAGLALVFATASWPGAALGLAALVMGATAVGWNGVMLAEAARIAPEGQVGAATAALSFAFSATMLVAPPAFTLLVALTGGYQAGFLMCVLAALGGAAALVIPARRRG